MSDIVKLREWEEVDEDRDRRYDPDDPDSGWEWPAPPKHIESLVRGDLRACILSKVGRSADDLAEVRLVESEIEGGWSEFTIETDFDIEVWVHDDGQAQRVFTASAWSSESAMTQFFAWIGVA